MKRLFAGFLALLCLAAIPAVGQNARPENKVAVELLSAASAVVPGQPFLVAVRQTIAPGWHTYWRNPGDSGQPMALSWRLPDGFQASEIRWPIPERVAYGPLMNYGYADEALFLVEMTPPANLFGDTVSLEADVSWLVCAEICIPEEGQISLTLPIVEAGGFAAPAPDASIIKAARDALARPSPWTATLQVAPMTAKLHIGAKALGSAENADIYVFPYDWGVIDHAAKQTVAVEADGLHLLLTRGDLKAQPLEGMGGLLVIEEDRNGSRLRQAFSFEATLEAGPSAAVPLAASAADAQSSTPLGAIGFWQAALFAVLGGLILNLMPCVFPVLSLKALALARSEPRSHHRQGLAYAAGVLVSFAIVAAILVALRQAGLGFGWGFQFQSPVFVLAMALIFLLLGLSLSGVFVIGGNAIGIGTGLASKPGMAGAFFTGVLATVVATPCTAPFMGAALGYALTQPAAQTVAILMALGVGLALPLTLLSFLPGLARMLPKPGRWMETFKQIMAFPLYASAGWMVWVLSLQTGSEGVLAAMVGMTLVGFAAWLFGRAQSSGGLPGRLTAAAAIVAALGISYGLLAGTPTGPAAGGVSTTEAQSGDSIPYAATRLAALQAEQRPVFINLTAAWCITCKVNEQVALSSPRVAEAMARKGIVYMKGDWTNQDPEISALLQRYSRAGVPLYLLIQPADAPGKGLILPQILTENILLETFAILPDAAPRQAADNTSRQAAAPPGDA